MIIYVDGATDRVCWVRDTGTRQTSRITYACDYAPTDKTTSNEGEWFGLVVALEDAIDDGYKKATVWMDSQLVVNQVNGKYKVKAKNLKPLYEIVQKLLEDIEVKVRWVRREENRAGMLLERKSW